MNQKESYIKCFSQSYELILRNNTAENFLEIMRKVLQTSDAHDQAVRKHLSPDEYVISENQTWVITQSSLEIVKMPFSNKMTIRTKIVAANRFFITRHFIVEEEGQTIISIYMQFAAIDFDTRKMVRLNLKIIEPYLETMSQVTLPFGKMMLPKEKSEANSIDIEITDEAIDLNQHVNNLYYLKWGLMTLPKSFEAMTLKKIDIKYGSELLKEHQAYMTTYIVEDTNIIQQIVNKTLQKESSVIKFEFKN